ncbi:MAG: carotenoid biosynthesis protein [Gemmatimonadaceae bacterium]|nr:carotenoid biosynthesis protein [Gemmatimonadaceae bacterium]
MERAAAGMLWGHLALIAFATAAMVTILAGPFPVWLQGPYTATVYELGWRYSGQVYVILGALAALLHSAPRFGVGRALLLFVAASGVALLSELGGTNLGLPFGPYRYTPMLGYMINGDVPYPIPISWYYMLYCCLAFCAALMAPGDSGRNKWRWALVAGAFLTAWDVPMEVQMTNVQPAHWVWELGRFPDWVPGWLGGPLFYGMPLSNWIGWFLTGVLVSRLMLAIVPPSTWQRMAGGVAFPLILYATNGIMPIATVARHGLWMAAVLGVLAMGAPLWLVLKARRRREPSALGATALSA